MIGYRYRAHVEKIYDGDTITVRVDLGFHTHTIQRLRLARIDAWEVRGEERPAGLIARDWLRTQILGRDVEVTTTKDKRGKWGRYIAEVFTLDGGCLNDMIVSNGHGRYHDY
jgi:micrococcal nuclease